MRKKSDVLPSGFLLKALKLEIILTYAFLYIPVVILIIYSFNSSSQALTWESFSFKWYLALFDNEDLVVSLMNSLKVAFVSTFLSTLLGTALAIGLDRLKNKYSNSLEILSILPLVLPEIVMSIGLLLFISRFCRPFFESFGFEAASMLGVVIGHVTFSLSYIMLIVRGKLRHMDKSLEEAAKDLGATAFQTLWKVTIPLLAPAILSGAALCFLLSLDDFYVTYFVTAGGSGFHTLPMYLYNMQARNGVSPEINALASLLLLISGIIVAIAFILQNKKTS